ncbi:MAG: tRNA (N(6)-L-threonylcarbamoyladenosine(37)-C(2))-methylthiotransferase MtaB [Bacteriovoracaceae bacterium]|nr:tRNA (N(6)-L-threonylcarbamoyladenosine(37)-C(2))-methylthiotransferase MtaB [Bacteriovoracaceae bacterium]
MIQQVENRQKTVAMHTLGCRLNFSETGSIAQGFVERGYQVVDFGVPADVVFLNTCTVTDGADSTCRNLIRKAAESSPEGKIVVAGCYAQMEAKKIEAMSGVDLILGTTEKFKVFDYLDEEVQNQVQIDKTNEFWGASTTTADSHTRAFLKIQDGCNYVCSFCIIPQARGRSRTITVANAIEESKKLISNGYKEVVLTGVNIGEYENTSGERLSSLVGEVLQLEGLERLRLSSVEPNTITDELLDVLVASPKAMDHFHIPLQSGDDQILKSMRRKYNSAFYLSVINKIKERFPMASIGADIIAGYPGETEEQFQNTYKLLEASGVTHFHVFPFSKRQNTTAAKLPDQIQSGVKKERVNKLIKLGERKLQQMCEKMLGESSEVLFETQDKEGYWTGYTSNYLQIKVKSDSHLKNQIRRVYCTRLHMQKLYGEIIY